MAKLGGFALSGQGLGSRAKKGDVAMGGSPNADDKKNAVAFTSGKMSASKSEMSTPRMNQAPAQTSNSRKGAAGTTLPLGKQKSGSGVTPMRLKASSRGANSVLPLGKDSQTSPVSGKLKNEK